jgi:two-component system nitrate/nitrite response regulator NarP
MARLLIADDHPIFLDGLRQFLSTNEHSVACCARNPTDALAHLEIEHPDMLILDVSMSEGGGLHVLKTVRAASNDIPVIFLTVGLKPSETLEAIKCGVNGIVLKHSDPNNLLACIKTVSGGDSWIDPTIIESVLRRSLITQKDVILPGFGLTRRQEELVRLVGQGLRNREIAEQCGLTEGTVKIHLHHAFTKLQIRSRAQLILMLAEEAQSKAG